MTITDTDPQLAAEIRGMTSAQLAGLAGVPGLGDLARAEQRSRAARARRRADEDAKAWFDMAYSQYLQAEDELRGELTNGKEPDGFDPWSLWSGPLWKAEHYASFELIDWWLTHPRLTVTEYREQSRREREAEGDDALDRDDASGVRQEPGGRESAEGDRDCGGHLVSEADARDDTEEGDCAAGSNGPGCSPVRPGPVMSPVVLTAESPVITIPGPADDPRAAHAAWHARHADQYPHCHLTQRATWLDGTPAPAGHVIWHCASGDSWAEPRDPFPPVPEPDAVDIAREQNRAARQADAQAEKAAAVAAARERLRAVVERAESVPAAFVPAPQPVTPDVSTAPGTVALRESGAIAGRIAPKRVDGVEWLGFARMFLDRYALWPSQNALDLVTLWACHAHARDASGMLVWQASPRLLFSSAEPGSGKSRAMKITSLLCPVPALFTEPSEPAVAHAIGTEHATIGLDEVDLLFGRGNRKAAIRAVINDGYTPDGYWARVRGGQVHRMPTFGAMMLAGLDAVETGTDGAMGATLTRCHRIRMRRGPAGWSPPRLDAQARGAAKVIAGKLTQWCAQELGDLERYVPDVPDGVGGRQAELWEPLLAVADIAGGMWPDAAREACEELSATGGIADEDEQAMSELDAWIASLDD